MFGFTSMCFSLQIHQKLSLLYHFMILAIKKCFLDSLKKIHNQLNLYRSLSVYIHIIKIEPLDN